MIALGIWSQSKNYKYQNIRAEVQVLPFHFEYLPWGGRSENDLEDLFMHNLDKRVWPRFSSCM